MVTSDAAFLGIYNNEVLQTLQRRFGPFYQAHAADLVVTTKVAEEMVQKMLRRSRRGEVVMLIPDDHGRFWLHTKSFYPPATYRLPTGGLEPGEKPQRALVREVAEETGFKVKVERCLAVLTYTFTTAGSTVPFVSYLFLTTPTQGWPKPIDTGETITDFRAVPLTALADIAAGLRSLAGDFFDWGSFRAIAHDVAGQQLLQGIRSGTPEGP